MTEYAHNYAPIHQVTFDQVQMPELQDYLDTKINWSASKKTRYRNSW